MVKNYITKQFSIIISILFCLTLGACGVKDKQTIILQDVKQEVKTEEVEVDNNIKSGNTFVDEGKFDEAKKSYEKAISIEPSNKDTYLKIKDKYIGKQRIDDAYYIIKLALENNAENDELKAVLEEIKNKFDVITIEKSIYQNNTYTLPSEVDFNLNNSSDATGSIKWNNRNVDTSKIGTFNYEGVIEQYGRKVKVTLNILANVQEKKIGYIKQVTDSNGKKYLVMDEVEFYEGDNAVEEAKKDEKAGKDLKANYFNSAKYYIRNNNSALKKYEISNEASLGAAAYYFGSGSTDIKKLTYEEFKNLINSLSGKTDPRMIWWIYIQNGIVTKVESQDVP